MSELDEPELSARVTADRVELGRVSTTERVADVLRDRIIEGVVSPGERLSEEKLRKGLPVSRNTLREAFRLLSHERLLVHEFNRGVFVRKLDARDVADLYGMRRLLECHAIRHAESAPAAAIARVEAAVDKGERARDAGNWRGVGTANMRFHQALTALAGSPRLDDTMRRLLAEGRLAFHVVTSWRDFHIPYLKRNRTIFEKLSKRDIAGAEQELHDYLESAEKHLVEAFAAAGDDPAGGDDGNGEGGGG